MIALVFAVIAYCRAFFIGRHRLGMEVAALRQQLVVFKRKQPRPRLCSCDRAFWVALRHLPRQSARVTHLYSVKVTHTKNTIWNGIRCGTDYGPALSSTP